MQKRTTKVHRTTRPLGDRELAVVSGGADLESAGEDLKTAVKAFFTGQLGTNLLGSPEYFT